MTKFKQLGAVIFAGLIGIVGTELAANLSTSGVSSFISSAEARVGRPLTPVSVAGATRRTVRRCAAGVYYC
jgi:hypothetical protein